MILLLALVTARRESHPSFSTLSPHRPATALYFLLFVYQTKQSCCAVPLRQRRLRRRWRRRRLLLLQYSGSRKSQINPFVIPHRSFQSVRISSTRFYATSAPSQNSSPFLFRLPAVLLKRRELLIVSYLSLSLFSFFSTYFTLPYFRHFFLLFLFPFILVASSLSRLLACARNYFFFSPIRSQYSVLIA